MASGRTRSRGNTSKPPEESPNAPKRDANGHFLPGTTPNPGGLSKTHREMRAAFMERFPVGMALIDKWLAGPKPAEGDRPAVEVSETQQVYALDQTLLRCLGKPVKGSDLPDLRAPEALQGAPADAAAMAAEVRGMLASVVSTFKVKVAEGDLGAEGIQALASLGKTIAEIRKLEAEAKAASKAGAMTDDELLGAVFARFGVERIAEALERFRAESAATGGAEQRGAP